MKSIIIDTNIIIDFTRGASNLFKDFLSKSSHNMLKIYTSVVVVSELLSGQDTYDQTKLSDLEFLLSKLDIVSMDYNLSKITGFLLRDYRALELGDAMIAATAISLDAELATRNIKDFDMIKDLKFFKTLNIH